MIGNFIADSVKGKNWEQYDPGISEGILMHRRIDDFTDKHPVFRETVALLRPYFGKFSGVVGDIYYDHFLAKDYSRHGEVSLVEFTQRVHTLLNGSEHIMPVRSRLFLEYMRMKNIPLPYADTEGIGMVLVGMSRRAGVENNMQEGRTVLKKLYPELQEQFSRFFPEVVKEFGK